MQLKQRPLFLPKMWINIFSDKMFNLFFLVHNKLKGVCDITNNLSSFIESQVLHKAVQRR